jgi:acetylornithine deacetylase/succinyl-diaminopimelate desuccinylase-like protein
MTSINALNTYLDENQDRFVEQLFQWLAMPSISALSEHKDDVSRAADWARERLTAIGFPKTETISTNGHPLVYAEWLKHDNQPTLLIYGHYDVQPVDPIEEWISPPFQPTIRDGNIFCRGASDDKAQIMLILAALEAWIVKDGVPPINIKILLEGEEEAGGASITEYVPKNSDLLKTDAVLICDTHMVHPEQPSLVNGLRGILYTEITVNGAKIDLHSGSYGGVAPNSIHALCILISRLKGDDGVIQIPELTQSIPSPSATEKLFWQEDPLQIGAALCQEMGVEKLQGETEYPPLERIGLRPTLEVHGIRGGFTGEGAKTVIPASAMAKVSLRLPANLDPDTVFDWFKKAVKHNMPAGYTVQLTNLHAGKGFYIHSDNHYIQAAAKSLKIVFGTMPVFMREGGSIPIAALFNEILRVPVVLMGFGLPDDTIHAPNEKFSLVQFNKGMKSVAEFLGRLRK